MLNFHRELSADFLDGLGKIGKKQRARRAVRELTAEVVGALATRESWAEQERK